MSLLPTFNEPGNWDFFISHTQRNGDAVALATDLYHSLERRGHSVWFDVKMRDKSRAAMEEGVRGQRARDARHTHAGVRLM